MFVLRLSNFTITESTNFNEDRFTVLRNQKREHNDYFLNRKYRFVKTKQILTWDSGVYFIYYLNNL